MPKDAMHLHAGLQTLTARRGPFAMSWIRGGLAIVVALLASPLALAEFPIKITKANVGLPPGGGTGNRDDSGRESYIAKDNTWAPVYVWLEIVKEVRKDAAIVIETTDTDDLTTRTFVPIQNLTSEEPGTRKQPSELRFIPYVRPSGTGEVRISIRVPDKGSPDGWEPLSAPFVIRDVLTRRTSNYVVLALGSELQGFALPSENRANENDNSGNQYRNGRVLPARLMNALDMPDQWFGYDAVDLAILSTRDDKFITSLFTDPTYKTRLDALLEWVRRGGRLVVSVGKNASIVSQLPTLQELLPGTIKRDDPTSQITKLPITWGLSRTNDPMLQLAGKNGGPFLMANVAPKTDRHCHLLVPPEDGKAADQRPTVLQCPFGLGRITMTAIDLDNSPFVEYPARERFWSNLLNEAGAAKAANGSSTRNPNQNNPYISDDPEDGLASNLRGYIDHFEGVPVISFGWVAVFILLYTLLIGPIEYFFLKKVLKRLELTWITFPIIVVTVSAIAYFTAYYIKGNDLKLNKVDIIDIDPASNRIYGRMWLTVFSPRPDNYRIGMTPAEGWTDPTNESPTTGSFVDWYGGTRRGGSSILRRNYWYHIDPPGSVRPNPYDNGLVDVPIPVWSTKSFSADWSAHARQGEPPGGVEPDASAGGPDDSRRHLHTQRAAGGYQGCLDHLRRARLSADQSDPPR